MFSPGYEAYKLFEVGRERRLKEELLGKKEFQANAKKCLRIME